jgi:hypothetical protein
MMSLQAFACYQVRRLNVWGEEGVYPPATMQKLERKGVAGGATREVVENKGARMTGVFARGGKKR